MGGVLKEDVDLQLIQRLQFRGSPSSSVGHQHSEQFRTTIGQNNCKRLGIARSTISGHPWFSSTHLLVGEIADFHLNGPLGTEVTKQSNF